ncbi:MAG: cytochrome P450 [Polyangiales bacterium]
MNARLLPKSLVSRPSPLDSIPGSDGFDELIHMLRDPTGFFHTRFERYGRLWKTRFVYPAVFAIGEEANKTILVTKREQFSFGQGYAATAVKRVFEGSIMLQDGEAHRRTREALSPAVGRLAVRETAAAVRGIWSNRAREVTGTTEDCYELVERTTFEVAANVLAGLALGPATQSFRPQFEKLIGGIMAPVPVRFPFGRLDRSLDAREALSKTLAPHVESARKRGDGLVGLLAQQMSNEEVIGHLLLLAWAGYDTTASAGSWVLHVLAQRPDWQVRMRNAFAKVGDDYATIEAGKGLEEVEWFLLEAERMYPSALFFPRVAIEDVEILGYTIPKDTVVFYSPYMSHRDPATFPNPNAFDPERWNPANENRPSPSKLHGFGGGPRVCLGKSFAKLQLKLMIQSVLENTRIEPDPTSKTKIMGVPVHHPVGSRIRFVALGS